MTKNNEEMKDSPLSLKAPNPFAPIYHKMATFENLLWGIEQELKAIKEAQNTKEEERFITKKEICEIWSCHMSTVDRALKDGKLKRYYLGSGVRFKLSEVMQALEREK